MKKSVREEVEALILKFTKKVDKSGANTNFYKNQLPKMSDAELEELVSTPLPIFMPNGGDVSISADNNVNVAKELGYEIYQHIWLTDPETGDVNLTTRKRPILELPLKRQNQMIDKKMSISKNSMTTDKMTGQVTGKKSRSSAHSFNQAFALFTQGHDEVNREFLIGRGGNTEIQRVTDNQLRQTGRASMKFAGAENTQVKSTTSQANILKSMHIGMKVQKEPKR